MEVHNVGRYQNLIDRITECVEMYEKMNFSKNRETFYLANGDIINYTVPEKNIAHLLGVKLDYLRLSNKFKPNSDSYADLKFFLDNSMLFKKLVTEQKQMNFDSMFSKNIDEKLDIFIDNIRIKLFDLQFIIKYDSERTYLFDEETDICDYYIVRKFNNCYNLLGLKKSDKGNFYVPATSRKYEEYFEFDNFVSKIARKQELTYAHLSRVKNLTNNYQQDFFINMNDKQVLIDKLINYAKRYDATAAVSRDFTYSLDHLLNSKTTINESSSIVQLLTRCINSNEILSEQTIKDECGDVTLSYNLQQLIDSCNDMIINKSVTNTSLKETYSDIINERNNLKIQLEEAKKQIKQLNEHNNELQEQNNVLINSNNDYEEQFAIIEKAVQKVKK